MGAFGAMCNDAIKKKRKKKKILYFYFTFVMKTLPRYGSSLFLVVMSAKL